MVMVVARSALKAIILFVVWMFCLCAALNLPEIDQLRVLVLITRGYDVSPLYSSVSVCMRV